MCKRTVKVIVEDLSCKRRFTAYLHPQGCMGARYTHLDIPLDRVRGCLIGELAWRGGYKLKAKPEDGCLRLDPGHGLPSVRLCVDGVILQGGLAYLKVHRRGVLYLSIQSRG